MKGTKVSPTCWLEKTKQLHSAHRAWCNHTPIPEHAWCYHTSCALPSASWAHRPLADTLGQVLRLLLELWAWAFPLRPLGDVGHEPGEFAQPLIQRH